MKLAIAIVVALVLTGSGFAEDKHTAVPDPGLADRVAAAQAKLKAKIAAATQAADAELPDDPTALKAIVLEQRNQIQSLRAQVAELTQGNAGAKSSGQPAPIADAIAHRSLIEGMTVDDASRAAMSRPKLIITGKAKVYRWDIRGKTGTHTVSHRDALGRLHDDIIADSAVVGSVEGTFVDGKLSSITGSADLSITEEQKQLWQRGDFSTTLPKQGELWLRD